MILSSKGDEREEMGIEELTLDKEVYKEKPSYPQNKRKGRWGTKTTRRQPQINIPYL